MGVLEHRSEFYRMIQMLTQSKHPLERRCSRPWSFGVGFALLASAILFSAVTLRSEAQSPDVADGAGTQLSEKPKGRQPQTNQDLDEPKHGPVPVERIARLINALGGDPADETLLAALQAQFAGRGLLGGPGGREGFVAMEDRLRNANFVSRVKEFYRKEVDKSIGVAELAAFADFEDDVFLLGSGILRTILDEMPAAFEARGVASTAISGRVVDAKTREGITGAFVYPQQRYFAGARTAADGSFELRVRKRPRPERLFAKADGYAPAVVAVPIAEQPPAQTITMESGEVIDGRVEDQNGKPVFNGRVRLLSRHTRNVPGSATQVTWSGDDGRFRFEHAVVSAIRSITADHPRYQRYVSHGDEGQFEEPFVVKLVPGKEISGIVRGDDEKPLAGAIVNAKKLEVGKFVRGSGLRTRATARGEFVFRSLETGEWSVQATADRFAAARRTVTVKDEPRTLNFRLGKGRTVTGVVLDSRGETVAGAMVGWIHWGETTDDDRRGMMSAVQYVNRFTKCDDKGRFAFDNLPGETITISSHVESPRTLGTVTVKPSARKVEIHLH